MPSSTSERQTGDAKAAAAERRRTNKPIMEKKRRQRINDSLNQLKTLVLEALKKDPSRYNKLEKADILEMTVRHVQALHRHQSATPRHAPVDPTAKYRAGFSHCASEVSKFLERDTSLSGGQRSRILLHLSENLSTIRGGTTTSAPPPSPSPPPPPPPPPPPAPPVDSHPSSASPRVNTPVTETFHGHQPPHFAESLVMRGVSIVPAHVLTGHMTYILPSGVTGLVTAASAASPSGDYHHHHQQQHQVPLSPPPSVASPSLSLASSPPASPCRSPSPQPLDLAPIRHPDDDCCWRPW